VLRASAHKIESHVALPNSRDSLHRGGEQEGVAHHKCDMSPAAPGSGSELLHRRGGASDYVGQRDSHATARNKCVDDRLGQKNCHKISSPLLRSTFYPKDEPCVPAAAHEKAPPLSGGGKSGNLCRRPGATGKAHPTSVTLGKLRIVSQEKAPHEAGPVIPIGDGTPVKLVSHRNAIAGFQPRLRPVAVRRFQPAEGLHKATRWRLAGGRAYSTDRAASASAKRRHGTRSEFPELAFRSNTARSSPRI
jgi:hypothetical protein